MTNEEKAREILKCNKCSFKNKTECNECFDKKAILEMAEWKDDIFRGFLFELSMLLTEPKTDIERAICIALPMFGLNTIDEVGDFLREKLWEYEHKGTILKSE